MQPGTRLRIDSIGRQDQRINRLMRSELQNNPDNEHRHLVGDTRNAGRTGATDQGGEYEPGYCFSLRGPVHRHGRYGPNLLLLRDTRSPGQGRYAVSYHRCC
jgi:hypothetical protein